MKIVTSTAAKLFFLVFLLSSGFFVSGAKVEAAKADWQYGYWASTKTEIPVWPHMVGVTFDIWGNVVNPGTWDGTYDTHDVNGNVVHYNIPGGSTVESCTVGPQSDPSPGYCLVGASTFHARGGFYATDDGGTTNINTYAPGATINIFLQATDLNSGNCSDFGLFGCAGGHGMRITATLVASVATNNQTADWGPVWRTLTAPSAPGTYSIFLEGGWYDTDKYVNWSSFKIKVAAPTPGICSSPATHYNCKSGALGGSFEYPTNWQWWCNGTGGSAVNNLCQENKPACGTANGKTYPSGATGYSPDTQCSVGVSTNTLFPPPGGTYAWLCNNNGNYSGMCQAWRAAVAAPSGTISGSGCTIASGASACIVPSEGGSLNITGLSNVSNGSVWVNGYLWGSQTLWTGAINSNQGMITGSWNSVSPSRGITYSLYSGPGNSSGLLSSVTLYGTCVTGTSWNGSSCVPPTYVCTGTVPANASMFPNDNVGLSVNTPYSYWATDTGTRCQYSCNGGYTWNGSSCVATPYSCTNLPSTNVSPYPTPDNTGLSSNTAYTYSATDTATKCQYVCDTYSNRKGSSCVTNACQGSVPANATMFANDNINLTNNTTNYSFYATDTGTRCQYSCNGGYTWDSSSNSCVATTYSCTGSLPMHATTYSGDITGLWADTPFSQSSFPSPGNTVAKCEFDCDGGYTWNSITKVCVPVCVPNGCEASTCSNKTCNNTCNPASPGTKSCNVGNFTWVEVAP